MNENQIRNKKIFLDKIEKRVYRVVPNKCICGANMDSLIGSEDRYGIPLRTVMCMNCGLVRSDPYYDQKTLKNFYENEYRSIYSGANKPTEIFFEEQELNGRDIVSYLEERANIDLKGKKVFEVGCGAGGILKAFRNHGAKVYGCDLGGEYLEKGKKENIRLVQGNSSVLNQFGKADVLILNHVLEHFLNPKEELNKITDLLKEDGLLFIALPGLMTHRKTYGNLKNYLQNAHVYNFTLSTLEALLNEKGFNKLVGNEKIISIFVKSGQNRFKKISYLEKIFVKLYLKLSYKIV